MHIIEILKMKKIKLIEIPKRTILSKINFEIENKKIEN